jgi:hypothetical protein
MPAGGSCGRTWTTPASLIRVLKAGCLAVDGPCSTVPSLSLKVDPCQGQTTQSTPPATYFFLSDKAVGR